MSHRRGHLDSTQIYFPCEWREARFLHRTHWESNPGPSRGSPLHNRCWLSFTLPWPLWHCCPLVIASAPWVLEWATKKSLDGSNSACTLTMTPFVYNVMCMFIDMYYGFKMRDNITALPPGDFLFAYQITRRPGPACTKRLNLRSSLSLTFS